MEATSPTNRLPLFSPPAAREQAPGVRTLIDEFLAQQAATTPVERFAATKVAVDAPPAPSRYYRDLLPATPPGPGQQYAFEVDLDACSGCKACVTACHSLNGLDEGESWREVGLLVGTEQNALIQPVTTGCHHCEDPGCLSGCPVDAYVKDDDGIVRHLDDQCIGCSYCTLTCPYEVPQFDHDRGIVRKCDMCHDRLAVGEAPACVQACPTQAIAITVVDLDGQPDGSGSWPFPAPDPTVTKPTTRFRSSRDLTNGVAAADLHTVRPRRSHTPLALMLVLTQLSVGAFVVWEALRGTTDLVTTGVLGAAVPLGVTLVGLVASLAHLGRPQYAWRAVLGLGHSWLSREIVAFGGFATLGVVHAAALASPSTSFGRLATTTGALAAGAGLAAVVASAMVYVATGRSGWRARPVAGRFGLTTLHLGTLSVAAGLVLTGPSRDATVAIAGVARAAAVAPVAAVAAAAGALALTFDLAQRRHRRLAPDDHRGRTARLLAGPLATQMQVRTGMGLVSLLLTGAVALALAAGSATGPVRIMAITALLTALAGELVARSLFFTAEGSPRMPGMPS